MTETLVHGLLKDSDYSIIHINTSDNKSSSNQGKLDLGNVTNGIYNLIRLIKCLIIHKSDIVYITIASSEFACFIRDSLYIISTWLFRTKVICHLHAGDYNPGKGNWLKKAYFKFVVKRINTIIFIGQSIKCKVTADISVKNSFVLYNGIEPVTKNLKNKKDSNKFGVLFIGKLIEPKGFFDVIKSIPFVTKQTEQVELWFAGEFHSDKERDFAFKLIKNYGVEKYVKFCGLITGDKKAEFFAQGDIFVLPSYTEGHPISVLEAMSAGLPVIATDVGSIKETVIDGESGFIVPIGEPRIIAEKILILYNNPLLKDQMSTASLQTYKSRFTDDIFLANIKQIFDQI